jgi:hypothetical protein
MALSQALCWEALRIKLSFGIDVDSAGDKLLERYTPAGLLEVIFFNISYVVAH